MIVMKRDKLFEALLEASVNGLVAFLIIYGTLCVSAGLTLIEALKPAFLIALIRFASYMAQSLDYVELPSLYEYKNTEKLKNSFKNIFQFVKVAN